MGVRAGVEGLVRDDDDVAGLVGVGGGEVFRVLGHAVVVDHAGVHQFRWQAVGVVGREQLNGDVGQRRRAPHVVDQAREIVFRVLARHVDDEQVVFHVSPSELAATAAFAQQGAVVEQVRRGLREQEDAEQVHAEHGGQAAKRGFGGDVAVADGGSGGHRQPDRLQHVEVLRRHHRRDVNDEQSGEQQHDAQQAAPYRASHMAREAQIATAAEPMGEHRLREPRCGPC